MSNVAVIAMVFVISLNFSVASAQTHKGISFQGVIKLPSGETPTRSGITVNAKILSSNNCVLREEEFLGVNISNGYINIPIGRGDTGGNDPGLSMAEVMDNSKIILNGPARPAGLACLDSGGAVNGSVTFFNPATSDGARKFRLSLTMDSNPVVADFNMRSMAYAVNSETLNGKKETDLVNINNAKSVTQANVESIFERFTKLDAILNNTDGSGTSLGVNITGSAATATNVTGTVAIANGGTGATTASAARTGLGLGSLAVMTPMGTANNTTYLRGDGTWATVSGGGGGSLSSVGLSLPSIFSVTSSPLTADGTISATLVSQSQHHVLAAPNASGGAPTFRALLVSDISNAKSAALHDVPVTGDAGTAQVVKGDDSRLTDARAPIDGSVTDAKIVTVSGSKITGTVPTGTLPVAGSGVAGIVSAIAQSFSGLKTFLNGIAVTGNASVSGNLSAADLASTGDISAVGAVNADRLKLANSSATCNGTIEGSLKYNSTLKKMEYCNGTSWMSMSSGVIASLSLGSPSSSLVKSGPVTFDVTYGTGVNTATITLASGDITIGGTDAAGCSVSSITGSGLTRTVTVNGCTGTGTVNISLAANTAQSTTGDNAPTAGPSTSYNVDNTGPSAPTGISLGSVPANFTNSPTITYSAASDVGGSTVANHQVQIIRTSDSAVIKAWANHSSGSDVGSLTLATNTEYSVLVRAVDALGNNGTASVAVNWTSINDPCFGTPSPGIVCTGGAIYLGSLSWGSSSVSSGPADRYMTTPGGCSDVPAGSISGGSGKSSYANADFTPTSCIGTDSLVKSWNDGTANFTDIPNLTNSAAGGTDDKYGSQNAVEIVAITASNQGGYHAAARYCDKLVYVGYDDWYLPNRHELNLMYTQRASIPGLDLSSTFKRYWSSTESNANNGWQQDFGNGFFSAAGKSNDAKVRCVRRF